MRFGHLLFVPGGALGLSSFAGPVGATVFAEDTCRRTASMNEYQGSAAEHLKSMYGGNGLPTFPSLATDTFVPTAWSLPGKSDLYNTTAQACRACR